MKRTQIATLITNRLLDETDRLRQQVIESESGIGYCYVDNLLPDELAGRLSAAFPDPKQMVFNSTMRERKYIAAQMNQYDSLLEETLFAFQQPSVVQAVELVFNRPGLQPDELLYAGGLSLMNQGCYLNPHIDNSHDKDRVRWRALNLLYYISPNWQASYGGNLELWPQRQPTTITSEFNRLAIMSTHSRSWHSVSPVTHSANRCCISNYYFSEQPVEPNGKFHVTRFRGRPGKPIQNICLNLDARIRSTLRHLKKDGVKTITHLYQKPEDK